MPEEDSRYMFGDYEIGPEQYKQLQFINMLGGAGLVDPRAGQKMILESLMTPQMNPYAQMFGGGMQGMPGAIPGMPGMGGFDPYMMGGGGEGLEIEVPDQPQAPSVPYAGGQLPGILKPVGAAMNLIPGFKQAWGPASTRRQTALFPNVSQRLGERFRSLLG